jgi:hypothetical protein
MSPQLVLHVLASARTCSGMSSSESVGKLTKPIRPPDLTRGMICIDHACGNFHLTPLFTSNHVKRNNELHSLDWRQCANRLGATLVQTNRPTDSSAFMTVQSAYC